MSRALFGFALPVGVFLVMFVIIMAIAQVFLAVGEFNAVIVGVGLTFIIGGIATLLDRSGRKKIA